MTHFVQFYMIIIQWENWHVEFHMWIFTSGISCGGISHISNSPCNSVRETILRLKFHMCEFIFCAVILCCLPHMTFQLWSSTCKKSLGKSHLTSLFPGLQSQQSVRNLGVTLDQHLTMSEHVGNLAAHASGSSDSCTRYVNFWAINRPTYSFTR